MHRIALIILLVLTSTGAAMAVDGAGLADVGEGHRASGETALMAAVRAGDARRVSALVASDADVNDRSAGGVTALMLAAAKGRADLVEPLLEAGARPDITDYRGQSARDWARENGHEQLARLLQARIDEVDQDRKVQGYDFADDAVVNISHPAWFKQSFLDLNEDLDEALAAGKQGIMLFISSRRCSYCKVFLERALGDPEIRRRVQDRFDVIGLDIFSELEMTDIDGQTQPVKDFVTRVKASYTPTLIFYGEGGRMLLRIVGYYPPDKFERVLDYLQGGHDRTEPLRSYLQRTDPSSTNGDAPMIVDRELFRGRPYVLDRRAIESERPLLVVFERQGCEACERFHRRVLSDSAIRGLIGQFEAVQLDVSEAAERVITPDGERLTAGEWFRRLDLNYSPAIVFFDEAGREVMRLDSETLRYRMEGSLQLVLEGAYEEDAQLQRWRWRKAVEARMQ